ncbi:MAG: porin family protein [Alphaproteobacteria bacterium]|nr:porin family protein [Alphaproteobacteria bacterium]
MRNLVRAPAVTAVLGAPVAAAAQDAAIRPYFHLHFGRAWYTDTNVAPGVGLKSPTDEQVTGGALGFDYGRFLSLEAVVDFVETQLQSKPGTGKIAEYAAWTAMAQARLRYPLMNDRLVPYFLLGVGWGSGELNDRNVLHTGARVDGSLSSSFVGAVGGGIEYFLTNHIAFGIEGKHLFAFEPEIAVNRQPVDISLDSYYLTGGFWVYFDRAGGLMSAPASTAARADRDRGRWYVGLRGGTMVLPDNKSLPGVELLSPTDFAFGASIGYNINRHWGVEFAGEYSETNIEEGSLGVTAEYSFWTLLALLRYRYPVLDGRLVPYVLAGAGIGQGEFSDRTVPAGLSSLAGERDTKFVGSFGLGTDWFVSDKVALTAELKHTRPLKTDATVNGRDGSVKINPISLMIGVRVFWD